MRDFEGAYLGIDGFIRPGDTDAGVLYTRVTPQPRADGSFLFDFIGGKWFGMGDSWAPEDAALVRFASSCSK